MISDRVWGAPRRSFLRPHRGAVSTRRIRWAVALGIACLSAVPGHAEDSSGLRRIEAGTLVDNPDAARWNSVVLLARPRIASGSVGAIPKSIRDTVSSFVLTIMVTVDSQSGDGPSGAIRYRLAELGVGYSMRVNGVLKIVTLEEHKSMGVRLGLIQRHMLAENEKQLATASLIAKTSTLLLFDAPALMLRNGVHTDLTMRHFVWVDPKSGRTSALIWLIDRNQGRPRVIDEPMRWVPSGTKEDRAIHVDGDEFILSIPTERAFALEKLPPGKDVPWTPAARTLAAQSSYETDALRQLTIALNQALQDLRTASKTAE